MHATGVIRTLLAGTAAIVSIGTMAGTASAQAGTPPGPAGTAAGTVITNTAQASYTVNGVQQNATSNVVTFQVDLKANLTVAPIGGNTEVAIGQKDAVVAFTVTNNTNGTQDFRLTYDRNFLGGLFAGANFLADNIRIFVDDGDKKFDATKDKLDYIDELKADETATVFIVADIPADQAASLASVTLIAQIAEGGTVNQKGAALVSNALVANRDNAIDVVFADGDSGFGDLANNGYGRAVSGYTIATRNVALSVTKSSMVISDGVSLTLPKAIPGATVQYCLVVNNATALVPAANVNLTDVIPANTTYVPNSLKIGAIALGTSCVLSGILDGVALADDGSTTVPLLLYTGSYNGATKKVTATIPTLLGGTSVAAAFRVTIN
nr:hypothetical protein [Sphingomonas sp. H160509]